MGLFHSIKEFFKSLGKQAEGTIDEAAGKLRSDSDAIKATFDDAIRERIDKVKDYRKALASLVQRKDDMLSKAKSLSDETGKLEDMKAGAAAKVRQLVNRLKGEGKAEADIQQSEDYKEGAAAFDRFASSLREKEAEIGDLEQRAGELEASIAQHKQQLADMLKSVQDLREEAAETVADVAAAGAETEARDLLDAAGKAAGANEELENLRKLRARTSAEARIAHELAEGDPEDLAKEFLAATGAEAAADEFASLVGLDAAAASTARDDSTDEDGADADVSAAESSESDESDEGNLKLPE